MSAVEGLEDYPISDSRLLMDRDYTPIMTMVEDSMYDAFLVDDTDLFDERVNEVCLTASCDV